MTTILSRRGLLASTAALPLAAPALHRARAATATDAPWPDRPLRLILPFPAGSTPDLVARAIGPELSAGLGQPVVVDNRPGPVPQPAL